MSHSTRLDPRSAAADSSIWYETSESVFRAHLVQLEECSNAVPIDPQVFPICGATIKSQSTSSSITERVLTLPEEQRLADDLASLAAVEEGAQSVSAVCLEQHVESPGLTVRFAAVDTIKVSLQSGLHAVFGVLRSVASASSGTELDSHLQTLFTLIVEIHHPRILGRLRSGKWSKPTHLSKSHKKPLYQDFANLIHRAQFFYTKKESQIFVDLKKTIEDLASVYQSYEAVPIDSDADFTALCDLIKCSYTFCTNPSSRHYARRLEDLPHTTPQIASAIKTLHQVEKIAAYWRISKTLIKTASQHRALLSNVTLEYLTPYKSIPTDIGYESWAKTCHVHAEIQLAAHYDQHHTSSIRNNNNNNNNNTNQQPNHHSILLPRTIGTSKHLCYLCHLFLTKHSTYHVSNTHGRLYDQWTIPDLQEFSTSTRNKYRRIIRDMNDEVIALTARIKNEIETAGLRGRKAQARWRAEPMTSREILLLDESDALDCGIRG